MLCLARVRAQQVLGHLNWPQGVSHSVFLVQLEFFFLSFVLFRATPAAYGVSQARGGIGAVATSLHQSHSNTRSELRL